MKNAFLFLIISGISTAALAQNTVVVPKFPIDTVTKRITYSEVVKQPGTPDTLYNRAVHWGGIYFRNFQSVAKVLDKSNGKIEGNYMFKVYHPPQKDNTKLEASTIAYSFKIELKENRYRYIIDNFHVKQVSYFGLERWLDKKDPSYTPECDYYLVQVDDYMQEFIKSLKKGMLEAVKVKDDW